MKEVINIVLIPSQEIIDLSCSFNKEIVKSGGEKIKYPHISILMGAIDNKNIPILIKKIKELFQKQKEIILNINQIKESKIKDTGKNIYSFNIEKTKDIYKIHKKIFNLISFFSFDIKKYNFSTKAEDITISWIKKHYLKKNYTQFKPHITFGIGGKMDKKINNPIKFSCKKIGIYFLGDYCSCTKEITTIAL